MLSKYFEAHQEVKFVDALIEQAKKQVGCGCVDVQAE